MRRIIINGANGYVASNFINTLLRQNYEVIALVRESAGQSSREKMQKALMEVNDGENFMPPHLKVYNYSLLDGDFGMSEKELATIFSRDVDYFHFAASLKYSERSKKEILQTNLQGVENSVKVFTRYAGKRARYFFISTAYSCGNFSGVFKEQFYDDEEIAAFRNYYEQSKRFAENIIKKHIHTGQLNAHVLRLSQVVGNLSGITKTDYGIFDFAKRVHSLALRYPGETVRVKVEPQSTQNLIAVDTVVDYLMQIINRDTLPEIMNLTSKKSTQNLTIISTLCKLLPINLVPVQKLENRDMSSLERVISLGMSFTSSYTNTNLQFDRANLDSVLQSDNHQISEEAVARMLQYFINHLTSKKSKIA